MTEKGFVFGNGSNKASGFSDLKNTPVSSFAEKLKEHKDDSFEQVSKTIEGIDSVDESSESEILEHDKEIWDIPTNKHKSKLFLKTLDEKEWHDHGYVLSEIVCDHEGKNFGILCCIHFSL